MVQNVTKRCKIYYRTTLIPPIGQIWEALFGSIPGFGHLFSLRRPPTQTGNRSIAIVQAVVEPLANDLFISMTFRYDYNKWHGIVRDMNDLDVIARDYHSDYIRCILDAAKPSGCKEAVAARPRHKE